MLSGLYAVQSVRFSRSCAWQSLQRTPLIMQWLTSIGNLVSAYSCLHVGAHAANMRLAVGTAPAFY